MKLNTRYERMKKENEYWSDTQCLAHSITEANKSGEIYSKGEIARVFKTVDKSDYGEFDYDEVLTSLVALSQSVKVVKNENIDQ